MKAVLDPPATREHPAVHHPAAPRRVVLDPPVARGRATGTRRPAADPEAVDAVGAALADPARRTVLATGDHTVHGAGTFTAHCDDPARPRPADSVGLGPSSLLRRFTELTGRRGPGCVVTENGTTALRLAHGLVAAGRIPVVHLCEVLRRPDTGAFWAVAGRVRRAPARLPSGEHTRPVLPAAGLDPVTRHRSAFLRACLRPRPPDPAEEQQ
ncbi:hypothetical protein [Streptomyces sp. NPDC021356]|uniref:hypothetical protein n=1 Tax=Streptomyces sp. NPDC021356 TaxID=3154900 RepID=UPI0033CC617F